MSNRNYLPDGFKQNSEGKGTTSPLKATCNQQSTLELAWTNGSTLKLISTNALKDFHEDGTTRMLKCTEKVPFLNSVILEKQKVTSSGTLQTRSLLGLPCVSGQMDTEEVPSQKEQGFLRNTPDQTGKQNVEHVVSPTTDVPTVVTLQKYTNQASPEPQNKAAKKLQADKSNVTVITLQKNNTLKHCEIEPLPEFQQNESHKKHQNSTPIRIPLPPSSSKQQNQDETVQVPKDQSLCSKNNSGLSPTVWNKEPPPPLLTYDFNHDSESRISKVNIRTRSRMKKIDNMNDFTSENSTGEPVYLGQEKFGFEDGDKSTSKHLTTILECKEDHDKILCQSSVLEKAEIKWEDKEDCVKKFFFTDTNIGLGFTDVPENGQNSPQFSALHASNFENQSQDQTNMKTEAKSKFKFKLPKNKLAALSQAIRTRTNKIGKKTTETIVIEKEEKILPDCRPVMETKKQTKESKHSKVNCDRNISVNTKLSKSNAQVEAFCKDAFQSINSLEESIKQLEISMDTITAPPDPPPIVFSLSDNHKSSFDPTVGVQPKDKHKERSPSKRSTTQILRGQSPPQNKRAKPQSSQHSRRTTSKKQSTSRTQSPSAHQTQTKSQTLSSGSPKKRPEGQQQSSQKPPSKPHHAASSH